MEMCKYTSRNIGFIHLGILTLYDKCRLIATKVRLKMRVCQNCHALFVKKSPDFLKPGLCHVLKFSYL